jgi:hypothetical protein
MTTFEDFEFKFLELTDPCQFDELLCMIHDEFFDLDEVRYFNEQCVLEIPYRRVFHNGPSRIVRQWIIYTVREKDVIRSRLRIHGVKGYEVQDLAQINTYSFNTIEYDPHASELTVRCDPDLKLIIQVSELQIESQDLEVKGKSRISYLCFLIESYSGKVYDS